jgi:hypothetical protein
VAATTHLSGKILPTDQLLDFVTVVDFPNADVIQHRQQQ